MSKNCPACNFEERHLMTCPVRVLILAGQKLREELAQVGDHTDMIWDRELLREWDTAVAKSDRVLMKVVAATESSNPPTIVRCTYCGAETDRGVEMPHDPDCSYLRAMRTGWKDEMDG